MSSFLIPVIALALLWLCDCANVLMYVSLCSQQVWIINLLMNWFWRVFDYVYVIRSWKKLIYIKLFQISELTAIEVVERMGRWCKLLNGGERVKELSFLELLRDWLHFPRKCSSVDASFDVGQKLHPVQLNPITWSVPFPSAIRVMNNCLFLIKAFSFSPSDEQTKKKEKLINMSCRKVFHCLSIDRGFWPPIENIQLQILKYSWIGYSRSFNRSSHSFVAPLLYPQHPCLNRKQMFSIFLQLKPKQMHFYFSLASRKCKNVHLNATAEWHIKRLWNFPFAAPVPSRIQPNCL